MVSNYIVKGYTTQEAATAVCRWLDENRTERMVAATQCYAGGEFVTTIFFEPKPEAFKSEEEYRRHQL